MPGFKGWLPAEREIALALINTRNPNHQKLFDALTHVEMIFSDLELNTKHVMTGFYTTAEAALLDIRWFNSHHNYRTVSYRMV